MFSRKVVESLTKSSWIRAMFEEGENLRSKYGADKVFDFSLGNPEIEPPEKVRETLKNLVLKDDPSMHRYMSNAGYADVREKIAAHLEKEQGAPLSCNNIIMTCGAAGGMNVVLKTLLNPGDEVIVFSPYFVEYLSYIDNQGGIPVIVPTDPATFLPDSAVLENYITFKTRAIIINSPNNPTGVVYGADALEKMANVLKSKEEVFGEPIFVIADEPYKNIVYDRVKVPGVLKIFSNSIIVDSFSKSLALPGERIGYIAVNSTIKDSGTLINGLVMCNRTLGFVNAPALFQKLVGETLEEKIDMEWYRQRRDMLYNHLCGLGFSCVKPAGAFYLFPRSPINDDVEFVRRALKYNLLLVPGAGFGCPGHFRISYCVSLKTIEGSLPAFEALAREFGLGI